MAEKMKRVLIDGVKYEFYDVDAARIEDIPVINEGTLSLQANGETKTVFEVNDELDKTFNIEEGSTDGTISVGGDDVAVHGLGSAAYTDADEYDPAGAADIAEANANEYTDEAIEALPKPMVFKGSVGEGGTVEWDDFPPEDCQEGWTYIVITKHTTEPVCEVGDEVIYNGTSWIVIPTGDEPSGTVTNVATGAGLLGGPITTTGTIEVNFDEVQEKLVSTENIKTINDQSLLGEGNIEIVYTGGNGINIDADNEITVDFDVAQEKLVSGTNIKTINDQSLLGEGNIEIEGAIYTGGNGILIDETNEISVDEEVVALKEDLPEGEVDITLTETSITDGTVTLDISNKLDDVAYDETNKKITKTAGTVTEDVVSLDKLKEDMEFATVATTGSYNDLIDLPDDYTAGEAIIIEDKEISVDFDVAQEKLVSGTNIKTINDQSLLGEGNIEIEGAIYTGGNGINIDVDNEISVDEDVVALKEDLPEGEVDITLTETSITDGTTTLDISGKLDGVEYDEANKKIVSVIGTTPTDVVTTAKLKEDMELATVATTGSYNDLIDLPDDYSAGNGIIIDTDKSISVDFDVAQEKLVSGTNIKTINGEAVLGTGDIEIEGAIYTAGEGINIDADNEISVDEELVMLKSDIPSAEVNLTFTDSYITDGTHTLDISDKINEVSYDTANKKFTETKNGVTTDIVELADLGLADVALSGDYDDLTNTPDLADVATSGDYNDLINKPTIVDTYTKTQIDTKDATILEAAIEYTDESIAALPSPMIFKGTVGVGGTVEWSAFPPSDVKEGWTYKVITKHTTTPICEVGDTVIYNGTSWVVVPSGDEPSGTVTNVATGTGLTGGPITTSGTIEVDFDSVQEKLVSATNIKTINGNSVLGSGNIEIEGAIYTGGTGINIDTDNEITVDYDVTQSKLVSGTSIKTINGNSVLGSGNIEIEGAIYTGGVGIEIDADNEISVDEEYVMLKSEVPSGEINLVLTDTYITDGVHTLVGGGGISSVDYDSVNKKITKTESGVTTDVVSVSTLKTDMNLATVATSGSYNDLTNKPTFATVATTGSYNDLTNKPDLYTKAQIDTKDATILDAAIEYTDEVVGDLPNPMVFKGTVGSGGTVEWAAFPPTGYKEGWTYKVITDHATAPICKNGDTIIYNGSTWVVVPSGDEPAGTVTNIATGDGLLGGPITSTGTIEVDFDSVQEKLVSGTNIKTINGNAVLGSGDIEIEGAIYTGGTGINIDASNEITVDYDVTQPKLISGTNIKTINGETVLGSGDIEIEGATYTAGNGIEIDADKEISIDEDVVMLKGDFPSGELNLVFTDSYITDGTHTLYGGGSVSSVDYDSANKKITVTDADGVTTDVVSTSELMTDMSLATVATSGDYNDLINKPVIGGNQKVSAGAVTFGDSDVVNFAAGANVSISGDAANKKITIAATDTTYTFAEGSTNGSITVTPYGGTAQSVAVHGLGSAAYTNSTDYDAAGAATTAETNAEAYTVGYTYSKTDIDAKDAAILSSATGYTYSQDEIDDMVADAITTAEAYTYSQSDIDTKDTNTLNAAEAYTYSQADIDDKDADTLDAAEAYTDSAIASIPSPMVFKGTVGTGGTVTDLPTTGVQIGWTYKVITAGTYAGIAAKVGDMFIASATTPTWELVPSGDDIEDTWRAIKVEGTELLGNGISTGAVNFVAGDGASVSGSGNDITIAHADTSTQASTSNTGRTYIQNITLDDMGHITALTSATETVVDTNTAHDHAAGDGLILTGAGGTSGTTTYEVDFDEVQEKLVSATNIKTINGTSLLGSGDITIGGGGATYTAGDGIEIDASNVISVDDTYVALKTDIAAQEVTTNKVTSITSASTDTQYPSAKAIYDNYQVKLTSGEGIDINADGIVAVDFDTVQAKLDTTNLKTINGNSLLGSGDIEISGEPDNYIKSASVTDNTLTLTKEDDTTVEYTPDLSDYYTKDEVDDALDLKQDTLVSGTNIKTINGTSVLGSGDLEVTGEAELISVEEFKSMF